MPTEPSTDAENGRSASADRPAAADLDLTALDGLADRPLAEHAAVYDALHAQLQGALNEIDRS